MSRATHDLSRRAFASDNYAGIHPAVLQAITEVNGGHLRSYGDDPYTAALESHARDLFGGEAKIYPMLTGTGANVVALQALAARHESVICAKTAHIHVDEGGAPERLGLKLLTVPTVDGKMTIETIETEAWGWGDQHRGQPGVISITQSTEMGTVYSPAEIAAIVEFAHAHGMRVHLDGARLANAAASLSLPVRAFTTDVGVDIVSFGTTKNGGLGAESIVVLNPAHDGSVAYLRKGSSQLASKMRFVSAQYLALLEDGLWLELAGHANAMAQRLAEGVRDLPGVELAFPVEANAVFAKINPQIAAELADELGFYLWEASTGLVRWMASWDTTESDIDTFTAALRKRLS
jgi:threonine aldolase